jgi:alpha-D-ribose 1-methylphosphonate 5-triphosphate synthase subunit PhnH
MQAPIASGFADPVRDQQRAFRAVMDALARPVQPVAFSSDLADAGPLPNNAFAIAITLLDFEVQYFLAPSLVAAEPHLTFHTGSRMTSDPVEGAFAFLDLRHDPLDLAGFAQGIPDYPDRSTTIVVSVAALDGGAGVTCRGPGIATSNTLSIPGLPADFVAQWHANNARAPLGVDMIFVSPDAVMGLPRSTRITSETR